MRSVLTAVGFVTLLIAVPVFAQQVTASSYGNNLSIALSPRYPQPGQLVQLSVSSGGLDLQGSAVAWRANGTVIAQGLGATSASIVAGALGSNTDIEVDVEAPDGTVLSAQATIAPTQIDILVGSDSYVPPFYLGRALPSAGTNLVLQAIAHFKQSDGTSVPDSNIIYTWKRNNEVIADASGRGKSSALISAPHLLSSDTITVDAVSSDGALSGEASVLVPSEAPVVDLYEDHPLYGILYHEALRGASFIPESEMSFAAVSYFAPASVLSDRALAYNWRVNDASIQPSASEPNELTISAKGSSGEADVALEVTHASNFYFDATGEWNIVFSSGSASSDVFHTGTQ